MCILKCKNSKRCGCRIYQGLWSCRQGLRGHCSLFGRRLLLTDMACRSGSYHRCRTRCRWCLWLRLNHLPGGPIFSPLICCMYLIAFWGRSHWTSVEYFRMLFQELARPSFLPRRCNHALFPVLGLLWPPWCPKYGEKWLGRCSRISSSQTKIAPDWQNKVLCACFTNSGGFDTFGTKPNALQSLLLETKPLA